MNISITIMAHPARANEARKLYAKLCTMPFICITPQFDEDNNEWENGKMSWILHDSSNWHVVIQDDAIISENFYHNIKSAIENVPEQNPISFYTGRVKPQANKVKLALNRANLGNKSWLSHETLLWGVCVAIPMKDIKPMLDYVNGSKKLYDARIGSYFQANNRKIYYTNPSLVDHDDSLPSLIGHDTKQSRVAHRYEPGLVTFNNLVEHIQ